MEGADVFVGPARGLNSLLSQSVNSQVRPDGEISE
jgi:hypothetical protein